MTGGAMTGSKLAAKALALVGVPFRLHGRDPATGLDCVGVLAAALTACGATPRLPNGYVLRNRSLPELGQFVVGNGLAPAAPPLAAGDVVLVRTGPCQVHLLIAAGNEHFVHAHAGLRRIICGELPADWAILRHWRIAPEIED